MCSHGISYILFSVLNKYKHLKKKNSSFIFLREFLFYLNAVLVEPNRTPSIQFGSFSLLKNDKTQTSFDFEEHVNGNLKKSL
jgi:hypothetical protein